MINCLSKRCIVSKFMITFLALVLILLITGCKSGGGGGVVYSEPEYVLTIVEPVRPTIEVGEASYMQVTVEGDTGQVYNGVELEFEIMEDSKDLGYFSIYEFETDTTKIYGTAPEIYFMSRNIGVANINVYRLDNYRTHLDTTSTSISILESIYDLRITVEPQNLGTNEYGHISCFLTYGSQEEPNFRVADKQLELTSSNNVHPAIRFGYFTSTNLPYATVHTNVSASDGLDEDIYFLSNEEGSALIEVDYYNAKGTKVLTASTIVYINDY